MTKDVIELAREAGFFLYDLTETHGIKTVESDAADQWDQLAHFAALVAARERERLTSAAMESASKSIGAAVSMTIERCARVCDEAATRTWQNPRVYAAAIRALNTEGPDAAMAQKGGE